MYTAQKHPLLSEKAVLLASATTHFCAYHVWR